jgi:hypothetical protein
VARVKKIIAMDEDLVQCSNSAAFAISVATVRIIIELLHCCPIISSSRLINYSQENFIRYLTEQAHNIVKAERKPRRNIQYKDFGWSQSKPLPLPQRDADQRKPMLSLELTISTFLQT